MAADFSVALDELDTTLRSIEAVLDVDRCCQALGIDARRYRELRPAYALAFRYIKRNYGPDVQARLDRLIVAATGDP